MKTAPISRSGGVPLEGLYMKKIDPAFLFELGDQLRKIATVTTGSTFAHAYLTIQSGLGAIQQIVELSIYSPLLRDPCRIAANALMSCMNDIAEGISQNGNWDAEL